MIEARRSLHYLDPLKKAITQNMRVMIKIATRPTARPVRTIAEGCLRSYLLGTIIRHRL